MQTRNFVAIQLEADASPVDGDVFILSHSIDAVTGLILQSWVPVEGLKLKQLSSTLQKFFLSLE